MSLYYSRVAGIQSPQQQAWDSLPIFFFFFSPVQTEISVLRQKQAAKLRELLKEKIRSEELHGERLLQPGAVVAPAPGQRTAAVITLKGLPRQRRTFGKFGGMVSSLQREIRCG